MTERHCAKELRSLLTRLHRRIKPLPPDHAGAPPDAMGPIVHQFIFSFLVWEASVSQAASALKRLRASVVDYNELRVCYADELALFMGERYPLGAERATRLRAALTDIYRREHGMTLERLAGLSKRDARAYLDSVEGVPPFVSARVVLLALGGHAVPLDSRLHAMLASENAVEPDLPLADATAWLERTLRAKESEEAYLLLEGWRQSKGRRRSAPTPARRRTPARNDGTRRPGKA